MAVTLAMSQGMRRLSYYRTRNTNLEVGTHQVEGRFKPELKTDSLFSREKHV